MDWKAIHDEYKQVMKANNYAACALIGGGMPLRDAVVDILEANRAKGVNVCNNTCIDPIRIYRYV